MTLIKDSEADLLQGDYHDRYMDNEMEFGGRCYAQLQI